MVRRRPAPPLAQPRGPLLRRQASANPAFGSPRPWCRSRARSSRLIRLGSLGRPSLSRIQFLAGEKPVSITCTITPLTLEDDAAALLLVGVDPIDAEVLDAAEGDDKASESLFPAGSEYLLLKGGQARRRLGRRRRATAALRPR